MVKKFLSILLAVLFAFSLAGCQAAGEKPEVPIETSAPPSAEPVRFLTEPSAFTRQVIMDKTTLGDENIVDVKLANGRAYVLTSTTMRVYQDAALAAEWDIVYDVPGIEAVRFAIDEGIVYVLCMDAVQDVYVLSYDANGTYRQAHLAMQNVIFLGRPTHITVREGIGYIRLSSMESGVLYCYDFASDTVEKTNLPYTLFAPYKDGKLLALHGKMFVDVFDPQTGESEELLDSSEDMFITQIAYHEASDTLFFRGQEKESKDDNEGSAKPNYLFRYALGTPREMFATERERLESSNYDSTSGGTDFEYVIAYSIAQNTLLVVEKGEAVVYSPIHGEWGYPEDQSIKLLTVTSEHDWYPEDTLWHFTKWEGPARRWLQKQTGVETTPIYHMPPFHIPAEDMHGQSYFPAEPLAGEDADMYLFSGYVNNMIPSELPLLDLSQYPGINDKMDAMLPGIKELCMRDGKLIGIPLSIGFWIQALEQTDIPNLETLPLHLLLGDYIEYLQKEENLTALIPYIGVRGEGTTSMLQSMIVNTLVDNAPSVDELETFLDDFKAYSNIFISSQKIARTRAHVHFRYVDYNDSIVLPAAMYIPTNASPVIRPQLTYAPGEKLPAYVIILSVNAGSSRVDEVLQLLETMCDKDFQLATSFNREGRTMKQLWYADEAYQEEPLYQDFADFAAQSCIAPTYDERGIFVLRGITEDYRTGEMDLQQAANEMHRVLMLLQDDPFSQEVKQMYEADAQRLRTLLDLMLVFKD